MTSWECLKMLKWEGTKEIVGIKEVSWILNSGLLGSIFYSLPKDDDSLAPYLMKLPEFHSVAKIGGKTHFHSKDRWRSNLLMLFFEESCTLSNTNVKNSGHCHRQRNENLLPERQFCLVTQCFSKCGSLTSTHLSKNRLILVPQWDKRWDESEQHLEDFIAIRANRHLLKLVKNYGLSLTYPCHVIFFGNSFFVVFHKSSGLLVLGECWHFSRYLGSTALFPLQSSTYTLKVKGILKQLLNTD